VGENELREFEVSFGGQLSLPTDADFDDLCKIWKPLDRPAGRR
jgi:hypothetical protein